MLKEMAKLALGTTIIASANKLRRLTPRVSIFFTCYRTRFFNFLPTFPTRSTRQWFQQRRIKPASRIRGESRKSCEKRRRNVRHAKHDDERTAIIFHRGIAFRETIARDGRDNRNSEAASQEWSYLRHDTRRKY